MQLFSVLYDKVLKWAAHRYAPWYLAGLSFSEAAFFPIPPDVMLAPMVLAKSERAWRYAAITTIASVLGGLLGYLIGQFAFSGVEPLLHDYGLWNKFETAKQWFDKWGFWALFLAGFSPIPYKVFTIAAGVVSMAMLPFLLASVIGRGARFCLVAAAVAWGGAKMDSVIRVYIDRLGWLVVVLTVLIYIVVKYSS
jgi:membrane protein YqaA with SNARE-associated domain